jgi:hypothetical protein
VTLSALDILYRNDISSKSLYFFSKPNLHNIIYTPLILFFVPYSVDYDNVVKRRKKPIKSLIGARSSFVYSRLEIILGTKG